jgi:hypothetical protein
MSHDHDNREDGVNRRYALERMIWTGTGILCAVSGGVPKSLSLLGVAEAATAMAQTNPTIPIIVKDITSFYWQAVLAGARKAGQDLGVDVPELGAQSESDIEVRSAFSIMPSRRTQRRSSSPQHTTSHSANRSMKLPRNSRSSASIPQSTPKP